MKTGMILLLGLAGIYLAKMYKGFGGSGASLISGSGGSTGSDTIDIGYGNDNKGTGATNIPAGGQTFYGSAPLLGGGSLNREQIVGLLATKTGTYQDALAGRVTWAQYDPITAANIGATAYQSVGEAWAGSPTRINDAALAAYSKATNAHVGAMSASQYSAWKVASLPAARALAGVT